MSNIKHHSIRPKGRHIGRHIGRQASRCIRLLGFAGFSVLAASMVRVGLADTRVFRCTVDGRVTLSDRPCPGTESEEVKVTSSNTYSAPAKAPTKASTIAQNPDKPKARQRIAGSTDESETERQRAKQACARLAEQLEGVESKLRSGYSIKEDKRLHDRQRELQDRQRAERCR